MFNHATKDQAGKQTRSGGQVSSGRKLFDCNLIKSCIDKLIPAGFPQVRLEDGVFVIRSWWKRGELKRIDLDKQNITDKIDRLDAETSLETLLQNAKRFRGNFSGKIDLTVTIKNKKLESLYWEPGNFIISKPFRPDGHA